MVHVNSALRLAQHDTYTQRNTARRGSATASADSTTSPATVQSAPKSTTVASGGTSTNTGADDFRALFSSNSLPPAPATPVAAPPPTAESVFGPNPWIANPGGQAPNGVTYGYNPIYFATPATAAKVAQMVGGKVVATNAITPFGPFTQNQQNQMVQLPSGKMINAGIIADFYNHGYSQQYINMMVSNEVNDTTT
jgi:hypothetical protein